MERATNEPSALADLFRLDHLTTRMRRNAEGLIILSGATPGRGWRDPVPVLDVLRAAIAEVEDYVRVEVVSESRDKVVGGAVNDVIHLIAELVENATTFSPPNTQVHLRADVVGFGVAIEVEDRGLGPTPEELDDQCAPGQPARVRPGQQRPARPVRGRPARGRHGIRVSLRPSPYGGTTAIVLLPHSIIVREGETRPRAAGRSRLRPAQAGCTGSRRKRWGDPGRQLPGRRHRSAHRPERHQLQPHGPALARALRPDNGRVRPRSTGRRPAAAGQPWAGPAAGGDTPQPGARAVGAAGGRHRSG